LLHQQIYLILIVIDGLLDVFNDPVSTADFLSSADIIRVIKSRRLRWLGLVARMAR
jgi:hypothetical protein